MTEADFLRSTRASYDLLADHVADAWRDELDREEKTAQAFILARKPV